jgi:hypothetical protein
MNLLGALLVVVVFALLIHFVGLIKNSIEVIDCSKESASVLSNPNLKDDVKEKILQKKAIRLFVLFGMLILGSVAALLIPIALVWFLDIIGILSFSDVLVILQRWDFLTAATVLGIIVFLIIKKIAN